GGQVGVVVFAESRDIGSSIVIEVFILFCMGMRHIQFAHIADPSRLQILEQVTTEAIEEKANPQGALAAHDMAVLQRSGATSSVRRYEIDMTRYHRFLAS